MSKDPPPLFHPGLLEEKVEGGDVGGDVGEMLAAKLASKPAAVRGMAVRGTAEGHSFREGEVAEPRTVIGRAAFKTEKFGKDSWNRFVGQGHGVAGAVGVVSRAGGNISIASTGPLQDQMTGWPGPSTGSGETSGETRLAVSRNECHNCSTGNYRANCLTRSRSGSRSRPNEGTKWKRSGATEQTLDGKKAKRGIKFLENSKKVSGIQGGSYCIQRNCFILLNDS